MTAYKKSMRQALQEMYLVEDNMSMMRKAAGGAAQTLKMKDGKLGMDSFTASAIMKVYDAVNDKNKKMIDGMLNGKRADIMKLQKFAMSKVNSSYNMEDLDVELGEEKPGLWANIHKKRKEGRPMRKPESKGAPTDQDFKDSQKEEVEIDEAMGSMRPETGLKGNIITKLAIDMSQGGMSMPDVHKQMEILGKKKLPELKKLAKELQMKQLKLKKEEVDLDEVAGTFTIVANGISDLKKADEQYLEDTEYSIAAGLAEDGVELDEEGVSYKGNSIMIPSDNEDMRMVQSWAKNQTKLAADTVKMIKPNMDYNDLYEERADHLYVAALLTNTAKPNKAPKYTVKFMKEEVDLDEGSWHIAKNMNALKKKMQKPIPKGDLMVKFVMKHIGDDELTDEMFDAKTGTDMVPMIKSAMKRLNIKEEVDLDEHKGDKPHKHPHVNEAESGDPDDQYDDEEERQVSEGRMKDLHGYIQDGKTAEQIAKLMKLDVKTIKSLMAGYNESAASDARRAIAKDKDFKVGKVDDADKDTHFDPRKDKAASANIIMQLRKAGNRASMGVEFGDGKKHKVPPQIAQKVQSKYNSYSRPAEKQAFQSKIAKSYKDMLKALKEDYSPIKETILDRIAHKLMERKND